MNRTFLIALMLASLSAAAMIYTVDTDRSGLSSSTLSIQGSENASVPLPDDAASLRIVGGSYRIANGSAIVSSGPSGFTTFSFTSSLFTSKTQDGWRLSFSAPRGAGVQVFMPAYSSIASTYPSPSSVTADSSRSMLQYADPGQVAVYYSLDPEPAPQQSDSTLLYFLAAGVIIALAIIFAVAMPRAGYRAQAQPPASPQQPAAAQQAAERAPTLDMTAGKKEMMETFNENDLKIANFLLSSSGKARRNELERKTGISKSSLAMALNRLEKRKILEIDRTSTTHFVKLSDYFLRL
jgi:uncharacterized membrane protein